MAAIFPGGTVDYADAIAAMPVPGTADITSLFEETQAIEEKLGENVHGAYPTLAERVAAIEAVTVALGNGTRVGLIVENGSAAPTTSARVTAEILAVEGVLCGALTDRPFDLTCDFTTTGKNGRIGTLADGWWYLWVGVNPISGEVATTAQQQTARASLDLTDASFEGLTAWRRVGSFRRTSGALLRRRQQGQRVYYDDEQQLTTTYRAAWFTESAAAIVPPTSRVAWLSGQAINVNAGATVVFQVRPTGTSGAGNRFGGTAAHTSATLVSQIAAQAPVWLDTSQQFDWQLSSAAIGGLPTVILAVSGYEDNV